MGIDWTKRREEIHAAREANGRQLPMEWDAYLGRLGMAALYNVAMQILLATRKNPSDGSIVETDKGFTMRVGSGYATRCVGVGWVPGTRDFVLTHGVERLDTTAPLIHERAQFGEIAAWADEVGTWVQDRLEG